MSRAALGCFELGCLMAGGGWWDSGVPWHRAGSEEAEGSLLSACEKAHLGSWGDACFYSAHGTVLYEVPPVVCSLNRARLGWKGPLKVLKPTHCNTLL